MRSQTKEMETARRALELFGDLAAQQQRHAPADITGRPNKLFGNGRARKGKGNGTAGMSCLLGGKGGEQQETLPSKVQGKLFLIYKGSALFRKRSIANLQNILPVASIDSARASFE